MATKLQSAQSTNAVPVSGFQFEVYTLDGKTLPRGKIGFQSVEGLNDETEAVEYKEGNDLYPDMLPGQTKPQEITLSRGVDKSNWLLAWRKLVREATYVPGKPYRHNVYVVMYDRNGTEAPGGSNPTTAKIVQAWLLRDAWPKSYSQADLNSTSSEITVERVALCYRGAPEIVVGQSAFPGSPTS